MARVNASRYSGDTDLFTFNQNFEKNYFKSVTLISKCKTLDQY